MDVIHTSCPSSSLSCRSQILASRGRLPLNEERKVDYVSQIIMSVDAAISEQTMQIVLYAFDHHMGVHSKDGHKGGVMVAK